MTQKRSGFLAVSILHVVFFELVCNIKMLIGLIKWDLFSTKKKREREKRNEETGIVSGMCVWWFRSFFQWTIFI